MKKTWNVKEKEMNTDENIYFGSLGSFFGSHLCWYRICTLRFLRFIIRRYLFYTKS
jgi:hypothetical protein